MKHTIFKHRTSYYNIFFRSAYTVTEITWPDCQGVASIQTCGENQAFLNDFPDILHYIKCFDENDEEMSDIGLVDQLPPIDTQSLNATADGDFCFVKTVEYDEMMSGKKIMSM